MTTIPTVSPTELIRSSWGNTVAAELNTKTVKVDGSMPVTGPLIVSGSPSLKLRRTGDAPYLAFENTTGATRFGYVQGTATTLIYEVDNAAGYHSFRVELVQKFRVDAAGVEVTGTLDVSGTATFTVPARFGSGAGGQLQLIDTSTSGSDFHDVYMSFYGAGVSMVSPGARTGYVGFPGTTALSVVNEVANGNVSLVSNGSGAVVFSPGGVERGRAAASLMWGKTTSGLGTAGVELAPGGQIYATTATNAGPNLYLRHNTDADGVAYVQFAKSDGNIVSQITQDNTAPVGIAISNCHVTAPSDYRLKNDRGPISDGVQRLKLLRPVRYTMRDDPSGEERDGFIAHEVSPAVPEAVTGVKDGPDTQQFDRSALVPLLTAAVLELVCRVESLEDQF